MPDPRLVSRAQRAATMLERAWERWRTTQGLEAEPLPPVSSYVGYSIEEPWGRPRVVFGVDAEDAERLAAFLQTSIGFAAEGGPPGSADPGSRAPGRPGFAADRPAGPDRGYDQSLLDDVRGRIPVQGWPPEFSESREQLNGAGPAQLGPIQPGDPELPLDLGSAAGELLPDAEHPGRPDDLTPLSELGLSDEFRSADDFAGPDEPRPFGVDAPRGRAYGVPYTGGPPTGFLTRGSRTTLRARTVRRVGLPRRMGTPHRAARCRRRGPARQGPAGRGRARPGRAGRGRSGRGRAGRWRHAGRGSAERSRTRRGRAARRRGRRGGAGPARVRRGGAGRGRVRRRRHPRRPAARDHGPRRQSGAGPPAWLGGGGAGLAPAGRRRATHRPRSATRRPPRRATRWLPLRMTRRRPVPGGAASGHALRRPGPWGPAAASDPPGDPASRGSVTDTMAAELAGWAAGELPGQAAARLASWATAGGAVARSRSRPVSEPAEPPRNG